MDRGAGLTSLLCQEYSIQITFREEWNDDRLQYDNMNGRINFLVLTDPEKIWKPDLFFKNEKKGHLHNIIMPNVLLRIFPNGNVLFSIRISLVLFCPMHLKYYPLDQQTCLIQMASCKFSSLFPHQLIDRSLLLLIESCFLRPSPACIHIFLSLASFLISL